MSGWFKKLVLDLLIPLKQYYVKELHDAMYGSGTDEDALIEILCTMNNQQIKELKATYEKSKWFFTTIFLIRKHSKKFLLQPTKHRSNLTYNTTPVETLKNC